MIAIHMQSAYQKEVEARLEFLNISSTVDIVQILKKMGQYSRFPDSQGLRGGESGGFFVAAERVGDSLSVCCFVLLNRYWGIVMYGPGASP